MDTIKVGSYIKDKRNEKNLTQKELAEVLNVTPQAVSKWEKGETLPDTAILLDLASHLETSVDLILNGGVFFNDLFQSLRDLEKEQFKYEILFLDATDEVLVKRFKEKRRSHPLSGGGRVITGIGLERKKLREVKFT